MENPLKNAKQRLLEGELAGFEFDAKMKKRVLKQIHSPSKVKKPNTIFPVVLSACLIVLFFTGTYKFILYNIQDGNNADQNTDSNVTVENDNNSVPPNKDEVDNIPQIENENDTLSPNKNEVDTNPEVENDNDPNEKDTNKQETNSEQKNEATDIKQTTEEESPYFDKEFLSLAEQGFIKGLPLKVGSTVGEIKKRYGEPLEYGTAEGAYSLVYQDFIYYYPTTMDYSERANVSDDVLTVAATFYLKDKLYLSDMKKGLGEPSATWVSEIDYLFYISYYLDTFYNIDAVTESGEEGVIKYIDITDWNPR
ncbi:hypothetical protein [Bacillus sp. JJ1562]|uniref:hypothetical protein n=1 Tax=Bacillus sp. JJ1562 TaxID=3122960 RepID=UPI0030020E6F